VRVSPLDARFPQLARIVRSPATRRRRGRGAYAAIGVAPAQSRPRRLHRPIDSLPSWQASRACANDPRTHVERGTVFAKLYPSEKGERVFRVATQVAAWLGGARRRAVTSVRRWRTWAADRGSFTRGFSARRSLNACARPGGPWRGAWGAAGAALRALHHVPQAVAGPLTVADFASGFGRSSGDIAHVPALLPAVGPRSGRSSTARKNCTARLPAGVNQLSRIAISMRTPAGRSRGAHAHRLRPLRSGRPGGST